MKKVLFILILLTICQANYSQVSESDYANSGTSDRFLILSGSPNMLFRTPNGTQFAGGIKIQLFITKRLSIDADLVFSDHYVHLSPGLIGVPLGLLVLGDDVENTFGDLLGVVTVLLLSFEHVSYHLPLNKNFDISPYVSLLRYKFAYEYRNSSETDYAGEQFSFAAGLQLNTYIGRFVFSPYGEYCIGYKDHRPGYNIGVYFGIYFFDRRHK